MFDLVAQHPDERIARDRLARKYGLRDIMTSPLDSIDDTGLAGMLQRMRTGRDDTADGSGGAAAEAPRAAPPAAQPATREEEQRGLI